MYSFESETMEGIFDFVKADYARLIQKLSLTNQNF